MCKILITEDERIIAEDLKLTLNRFGHEVVGIATSGEEAIDQIEQYRPDLILMDIMLVGNLNGIETVRYINERFSLPVIYLTAYGDDKTMKDALATDPQGFLIKPVKESQLHAAIEIAMNPADRIYM